MQTPTGAGPGPTSHGLLRVILWSSFNLVLSCPSPHDGRSILVPIILKFTSDSDRTQLELGYYWPHWTGHLDTESMTNKNKYFYSGYVYSA